MKTLLLRPHHFLDIIADYGAGLEFTPAESGNARHNVAKLVLEDQNVMIRMHVGADEICSTCKLLVDGLCTNELKQVEPPRPMQEYNDALDEELLRYLDLTTGATMKAGSFFETVGGKLPGIEKICTHPGEDESQRRENLEKGLQKLGAI